MLLSSSVMLLRSAAIRSSVFLVIWNSTRAARILARSSFISLTFKPCVCTRIVTAARLSLSVNSAIFSDLACVGISLLLLSTRKSGKKFGLRLFTEDHNEFICVHLLYEHHYTEHTCAA